MPSSRGARVPKPHPSRAAGSPLNSFPLRAQVLRQGMARVGQGVARKGHAREAMREHARGLRGPRRPRLRVSFQGLHSHHLPTCPGLPKRDAMPPMASAAMNCSLHSQAWRADECSRQQVSRGDGPRTAGSERRGLHDAPVGRNTFPWLRVSESMQRVRTTSVPLSPVCPSTELPSFGALAPVCYDGHGPRRHGGGWDVPPRCFPERGNMPALEAGHVGPHDPPAGQEGQAPVQGEGAARVRPRFPPRQPAGVWICTDDYRGGLASASVGGRWPRWPPWDADRAPVDCERSTKLSPSKGPTTTTWVSSTPTSPSPRTSWSTTSRCGC